MYSNSLNSVTLYAISVYTHYLLKKENLKMVYNRNCLNLQS